MITLLPSTALDGLVSRIVPELEAGSIVTIPRFFADIVITEFGTARLLGKNHRERAGELIHLDIKKLARIERIGHRIHGDRSKTVEGAGWEYLHVCIDDASRVSYAEVLPNERGVTCAAFLERAAAWLRRCGVVVEGVE